MYKKNRDLLNLNFFKRDKIGENTLWKSSLCSMKPFFCKGIPLIVLLILFSMLFIKNSSNNRAESVQKSIASEILRFHVIANSDSDEDQALKMEIKEAVTKSLEPMLDKVSSVEETRAILSDNLTNIEELANEIIAAYHFPYSATATIENGYFPLKVYGDVSLPPGEYEALRIELGEALGKNWWCIMFPPLCFVDSTYSVVPESSKEQLQYVLTDEEYDSILIDEESNELIEEDSSDDKVDGNEIDGNETEDKSLQDITNDADDSVDVKVKFKIFTFLNDVFDLD